MRGICMGSCSVRTHEEHRSSQSLAAGFAQETQACGIIYTVVDSDLSSRMLSTCYRSSATTLTALVSWIAGPSAIGSENGTPSSMISEPPSCIASIIGTVSSIRG